MMLDLTTLNFDKGGGLVTVVAQDARTGAVLVAYADREALERTIDTGEMHYHALAALRSVAAERFRDPA